MDDFYARAIRNPEPMSQRTWEVVERMGQTLESPTTWDVFVSIDQGSKARSVRVAKCTSQENAEQTLKWLKEVYFGSVADLKKQKNI